MAGLLIKHLNNIQYTTSRRDWFLWSKCIFCIKLRLKCCKNFSQDKTFFLLLNNTSIFFLLVYKNIPLPFLGCILNNDIMQLENLTEQPPQEEPWSKQLQLFEAEHLTHATLTTPVVCMRVLSLSNLKAFILTAVFWCWTQTGHRCFSFKTSGRFIFGCTALTCQMFVTCWVGVACWEFGVVPHSVYVHPASPDISLHGISYPPGLKERADKQNFTNAAAASSTLTFLQRVNKWARNEFTSGRATKRKNPNAWHPKGGMHMFQ